MVSGTTFLTCILFYFGCGWLTVFVIGLFDESCDFWDDLLPIAFTCWPVIIMVCLLNLLVGLAYGVKVKLNKFKCIANPAKWTWHYMSYLFKPYSLAVALRKCFSKKEKNQ